MTHHKTKKKNGKVINNKMDGMTSINTSVQKNEFCQSMMSCDKSVICASCYTRRIKYPNVEKPYAENYDLFNSVDYTPVHVNHIIVRLHAVGELSSELHFSNIIKLVNFNPQTRFVLWTKRIDIVNAVFANVKKPKNLTIIRSSVRLNTPDKKVKYIDKVFTVYTPEYIVENGTEINCQKKCSDCMLCYTKNDIVNVNELISF